MLASQTPLAQSRAASSSTAHHTSLTPMIDAMGMRSSSSGAGMRTGSESTFFLEHAQSTAGSSGEQIPSQLRSIVLNAIAQNLHQSAIFFAEKLIRCSGATPRDAVLYAKTYYGTGEYRRCLAVLEQKGLLSAEAIVALSECLRPSDTVANPNGYHGTVTGKLRDFLSAAHLASLCLLALEQYDDCATLLEPLLAMDDDHQNGNAILIARCALELDSSEINPVAAVYCAAGRCFDCLENSTKALKAFLTAIRIDASCVEALEHIVKNSMLSSKDRANLYYNSISLNDDKIWLDEYYRFMLLGTSPENNAALDISTTPSPVLLIRKAEFLFEHQQPEEAYRLSRLAYTIDPFYWQGLLVYIASMADLQLKTELFYLGHELANTYPKMAVSWYAVGVYYWCCRKLEMAQKYLMKATKMDKKFAKAWVALGHVLSSQEESEHAISAFRTATRLLPGDHRPLVFMAKELFRTNYLSLALHMLSTAHELAPSDAGVLNELGVVHMRLNRLDEALDFLAQAVTVVQTSVDSDSAAFIKGHGDEVFSNYATALRKSGKYDDALYWYSLSLSVNPTDAGAVANLAFTYHLMQRFDDAINAYHRALAINPTYTFVSEMLNRAISQDRQSSFSDRDERGEQVSPSSSSFKLGVGGGANVTNVMLMTNSYMSRSSDCAELSYNLGFDVDESSILSER